MGERTVTLTDEQVVYLAEQVAIKRKDATIAIQMERELDDDPAYSERYIDRKSREVAAHDAILAKLGMEVANVWATHDIGCVCGERDDFTKSDAVGGDAPDPHAWAGHVRCGTCGRVIDTITSLVMARS